MWILEDTWRLVEKRFSMRQYTTRDQVLLQRLYCQIVVSLKADRRRWTEKIGGKIQSLLTFDPPLTKEAWFRMKGWYKAEAKCAPPPA